MLILQFKKTYNTFACISPILYYCIQCETISHCKNNSNINHCNTYAMHNAILDWVGYCPVGYCPPFKLPRAHYNV